MSNTKKIVAAISVAGAMLVSSPASFAQDQLSAAYVNGVYADCYYNVGPACNAPGAYAAIAPVPVDAYAAVNGVVQPTPYSPYLTTGRWITRGLRGADWVAIHGTAF